MVLACALWAGLASVTVIPNAQLIYNQAPRLRIKGTGFPADLKSLSLEISMNNQAPLQTWVDFVILKDPENEGILLSLRGGKRCVCLFFLGPNSSKPRTKLSPLALPLFFQTTTDGPAARRCA